MTKLTYQTNLSLLFAIRFFSSLIPAYVIERLYWEERGMTIGMVVYTEIIYALTIVVLEVPTGILADRRGRKNLLALSAVLGCSEFVVLLYAETFWHFALVVFLAGISRSAGSGAENALLYDSLALQGKASSFEKQLGRLNAFDLSGALLAALCGSLLASRFNLELNYWVSLASAAIAMLLTFFLVEPPASTGINPDRENEGTIPLRQYVTLSLRFFRDNPAVRIVVLAGMVTGTAIGFIDEFWQLYVERLGMPIVFFGLVSSGLMLLRLPGNLLAQSLLSRFPLKTLLYCVLVIFVVGFAYSAFSPGYFGLAALLVVCLFSGVMEPLAAGYLHHRIGDSSMRATIDSFQSLGLNAIHIVTGLGFGYFSSRFDVFGGFGFLALFCLAFALWFGVASRRGIDIGG